MDKRPWKGKRVADEDIMKPIDMKKQRTGATISIKQKLDFRAAAAASTSTSKPSLNFGASSSNTNLALGVRPILDEKWQDFGDTINLNAETFRNSLSEALAQEKFNKVARMFTAALKSFLGKSDKMSADYRMLGSIMETVKGYGAKLNHVSLHRGLLNVLCMSKCFPASVQDSLIAIITELLDKQETVVDKAYITAFIYDAVGFGAASLGGQQSCTWIEKEAAKALVASIIKPIGTIFPNLQMYNECQGDINPLECFPDVENGRIPDPQQAEVYLEYIRPWFDCLRGENPPKALLRTLGWLCGYPEVRHFVATRLDIWLQNPKFQREAMELLLFIGCNMDYPKVDSDKEVAEMLIRLRNLKTRPASLSQTTAIRYACQKEEGNMNLFVRLLIGNELGEMQNRSQFNQPIMHSLFTAQPEALTRAIGIHSAFLSIFHEETVKNLRILLKELIRTINMGKVCQFPFATFAENFYHHITWQSQNAAQGIPEDVPLNAAYFIAQVVLMCISSLMSIRGNSFNASQRLFLGNEPMQASPEAVRAHELFNEQFRRYCLVTVEWLTMNKAVLFADPRDHVKAFYHALFLDTTKTYTTIDSPVMNESEFSVATRLFGEAGIEEELLLKIFGERICSLEPTQALEVVWLLTHRVASGRRHLMGSIMKCDDSFRLIDKILKMTDYFPGVRPDLIRVAHRSSYLTAWRCILLWLCAGGTTDNFELAYNGIPMLRYLVYSIMTKNYDSIKFRDELAAQPAIMNEATLAATEAKAIAEFEAHGKTQMAHYLCLLITREGYLRSNMYRELHGMVEQFRLAGQLAKCGKPPLLDLLVASVGATATIPAIVDMLNVDPTSVELMSPTCVYTTLLHYIRIPTQDEGVTLARLTARTKELLESCDEEDADETIRTMLTAFSSSDSPTRAAAIDSLSRLFPSTNGSFDLNLIRSLSRFEQNKGTILELMARAVNAELETPVTASFILFLCESMDPRFMHQITKTMGEAVNKHRPELSASFCDFFVSYIDKASSTCKLDDVATQIQTLDPDLIAIHVATVVLTVHKTLPESIIELLSSYPAPPGKIPGYFELLIDMWLVPSVMPKIYSPEAGNLGPHSFMTVPIRKKMLRSKDERFVEAALHGLSEEDAQAFIFTPQMSIETADKIIGICEEKMNVSSFDVEKLSTLCILLKGYRLNGATSGGVLLQKVNDELAVKRIRVEKEEATNRRGIPVAPSIDSFMADYDPKLEEIQKQTTSTEVQAWLKANTTSTTETSFDIPLNMLTGALADEKIAMTFLNHIETYLKFFIANSKAFQTVVVLVDAAAAKFENLRSKLELLSAKLLKSAKPPPSISFILKKHAIQARPMTPAKVPATELTNAQVMYCSFKKAGGSEKKKTILADFMVKFERKNTTGSNFMPSELPPILRCLTELSADASVGEKFAAAAWSRNFRKRVLYAILRRQTVQFTGPLIVHMLYTYCKQDPFISYHELFCGEPIKPKIGKKMIHPLDRQCVANLAIVSSYTIADPKYSTLDVMKLVEVLEKHGGLKLILALGQEFLAVSQSDVQQKVRSSSLQCINALQQQYPSLHFKEKVISRMELRDRIESKEECFERCERLVDQVIEVVDEHGNLTEKDETVEKPPPPPPPPRGRGRWQRENVEAEDPGELAWITMTVSQLNLMFNDYPHVVKIMFSKLANFVSTLNAMSRKEVNKKKRALKVEVILKGVEKLTKFMNDDELICVEMALTNCFLLYQKHVEESSFHIRDQLAITDAIVRACTAFLRKNVTEARELLIENRPLVERICARTRDREEADMVINSIILPPI